MVVEKKERMGGDAARCGAPYGELAAKEDDTYIIPRPLHVAAHAFKLFLLRGFLV